ncbi:hypothetical protein GIB67_005095, partial [Kingdonia uniflora]
MSSPSLKLISLNRFYYDRGCLNGIVRTIAGYAGGAKLNLEFRSLADHAECVQIEYDPKLIRFRQLLDVFWSSQDSRQVFGQGPDVGNQYGSIIFTNGTEEVRLAATRKEREQTKSRTNIVTTQIQKLGTFYSAEPEHQVELKTNCIVLRASPMLLGLRNEQGQSRKGKRKGVYGHWNINYGVRGSDKGIVRGICQGSGV